MSSKSEKRWTVAMIILVTILMIVILVMAIFPLLYKYSYMDTEIDTGDPDTYVEVFLRSLLIKDERLLRDVVASSRWEDVEAWIAKEPTVNCDPSASLEESEFAGYWGHLRYDVEGNLEYLASFNCFEFETRNYHNIRLVVNLERLEKGYQIVAWKGGEPAEIFGDD